MHFLVDGAKTQEVIGQEEQSELGAFVAFRGDASVTCGASLQSGAVGGHHARVSGLAGLSNTNLKWTTGDVAPIELHIDQIEAILSRNEADRVLVCQSEREMESG